MSVQSSKNKKFRSNSWIIIQPHLLLSSRGWLLKIRQQVQTVYLKKKTLIEGAKAPALHSIVLMCNRSICSIDEELSETDRRDQGPSIVVVNKIAEASNLHRVKNQSALEMTNSAKRSLNLKGNMKQSGQTRGSWVQEQREFKKNKNTLFQFRL